MSEAVTELVTELTDALRGSRDEIDQRANVEVWKNTAAGKRYYIRLDRLGHEASHVVNPKKTFTLSTFERQLNQERAATPKLDMFRNGSFVLVKPGADTDKGEIESANSLTDNELLAITHELLAKNVSIQQVIHPIDSPETLHRLYEALVLEDDMPKGIAAAVKAKKDSFRETKVIRKEVIEPPAPPGEDDEGFSAEVTLPEENEE